MITVRYWAAARAAAGVEAEQVAATDVRGALAAAQQAHPALATVIPVSSVLIDGVRVQPEHPLADGATIEVLPPFAGG